jgi:hypothetical protein
MPCVCIYTTLFFAWFEREQILTKYKCNLVLYCCQIDDIFGIWQHDKNNPDRWTEFKSDINSYTKLDWNTEELSSSVNFLNLMISLENKGKTLTYKTYQKPMNLFLYIPGHSAHTPGVVKSLIFGLLQTYHRQNKHKSDFHLIVKQLFKRLLARGHKFEDIYPIFIEAASKVDLINNNKINKRTASVQQQRPVLHQGIHEQRKKGKARTDLFSHLPYHPRDISRKQIQEVYKKTCENKDNLGESFTRLTTQSGSTLPISKLTVAYSRPKNLRDILCSSTLKDLDDCNISDFL